MQTFNLLWSVWLFLVPVLTTPVSGYVISLAVSYPIFLVLFAAVYLRPYREISYYSVGMLVLACAVAPFNQAGWTYAVFACVYVPYTGSLGKAIAWMLAEELVVVVAAAWYGWPWQVLALIAGVCSSAGFGGLMARVNAMKRAGELASSDEVRRLAANAERERIGRDLHDLLGHTLSLITLKLELAGKLFDADPERARTELTDAEKVARQALAEVRAAVTGIRATGLAGELASAQLMLRTSGVDVQAEAMPALPDAVDDVLAMVLREAATNIHRHARASHADISVEVVDGHARMRVCDDGRGGIDVAGNGLKGMRERVETMSGHLAIHSLSGQGTELVVDIPLPRADKPALDSAHLRPDCPQDKVLPLRPQTRSQS
ncbi:MAG TPA: sensor histidine kinase [Rhodanobacteraceae bacterium]